MRRSSSRKTSTSLEVRSEVTVTAPASEVWDAIKPAESSMRLGADVAAAGSLPDFPTGAGEMQYYVFRVESRLMVSVSEVVEEEPGRRALTQPLIGVFDDGTEHVSETLVEEDESGTVLCHRYTTIFPPRTPGEVVDDRRTRTIASIDDTGDRAQLWFGSDGSPVRTTSAVRDVPAVAGRWSALRHRPRRLGYRLRVRSRCVVDRPLGQVWAVVDRAFGTIEPVAPIIGSGVLPGVAGVHDVIHYSVRDQDGCRSFRAFEVVSREVERRLVMSSLDGLAQEGTIEIELRQSTAGVVVTLRYARDYPRGTCDHIITDDLSTARDHLRHVERSIRNAGL
jgi:hypothetical protein